MGKIASRKPAMGLTKVEIDFGSGSKAMRRYVKLHVLLTFAKRKLRKMGNLEDARTIYLWQCSIGYKIDQQPQSWVLEMTGQEWVALSRALRQQGTKGRTMVTWLTAQRVCSYD